MAGSSIHCSCTVRLCVLGKEVKRSTPIPSFFLPLFICSLFFKFILHLLLLLLFILFLLLPFSPLFPSLSPYLSFSPLHIPIPIILRRCSAR